MTKAKKFTKADEEACTALGRLAYEWYENTGQSSGIMDAAELFVVVFVWREFGRKRGLAKLEAMDSLPRNLALDHLHLCRIIDLKYLNGEPVSRGAP